MKRYFTIFIVFLIVMTGFVFAVLNASATTFNYYLGQVQLPLSLLLVIAFILGGMCGLLFNFKHLIKHKIIVHRLTQQIKKLTSHVDDQHIEN